MNYLFKIYFCLFTVLFASVKFVAAQETIITDRPDQTESSVCVTAKSIQIESGVNLSFTNKLTSVSVPNTLFRVGLFPFLELRLFHEVLINKHSFNKNNFGISDFQVGFKMQLFKKENHKSTVALLSHLIIPSGSNELSEDHWGSSSRLLVTHQLSERNSLAYNFGYTYHNSKKGDLIYTLSLAHALTDKLGLFAELYGELIEFDKLLLNGDAGITYLIKPNLQLDLSYGIGVIQKMNFISFGVSWNIAPKANLASPISN